MFKLDSFYYDVGGGCPILGFWSTSCLSWTVSTMMWVVVVQYCRSRPACLLVYDSVYMYETCPRIAEKAIVGLQLL